MAYARRYVGGFVNGDGSRQVDATFLNSVEAALLLLFDANPTLAGQVQVWNGAKFAPKLLTNAEIDPAAVIAKSKLGALNIADADVAGAAGIARSKLNLANAIVQPTDFAAGSKITTSALSGGPPASPSTGDIWIATAVDSIGTRWQFQYDSTQPTYKWICVGGPPSYSEVVTSQATTGLPTTPSDLGTVGPDYVLARPGNYLLTLEALISTGAVGAVGTAVIVDTAAPAIAQTPPISAYGSAAAVVSQSARNAFYVAPAATTLRLRYYGNGVSNPIFENRRISVLPVKIS